MKTFPKISASLRLCGLIFLFAFSVFAQTVPTPKDVLGWTPGDDKKLASWEQIVDYFKKLDAASDRVKFEEIGKTTMGRPFVYATISAPENLKNLEKYKQINAKLADPRLIKSNDALAKQLIKEGKTVVVITCGIHSTEVGGNLSSMLIADKLATSKEPEILKILQDTIILLVPSLNPDGNDIVKNWYDKTLGTPYEGTSPPELYHKYTGHDNNRDWYAFTQVETQLTVSQIHNVWHPQIVNDIHQQGANGSRIFIPPYMQPVEPNVPKEIVEGYTELGNFMADEMRKQGFQGITTNSTYDAWTPARAYSHYHGGVRILTETASAKLASPTNVTFDQLRDGLGYDAKKESDNFKPLWKGGEWHLRDITNYMTAATFQLLKHASINREKWLTKFYAIGKEEVRTRKKGEVYAYVIPKSKNSLVVTNALEQAGVKVEYPVAFEVDGRKFDAGTAIVRAGQPYFNFAVAMLVPQKYPDMKDDKGNPIPPYDVTAHTFSLLTNTEFVPVYKPLPNYSKIGMVTATESCKSFQVQLYRSYNPSMDEGWTRWAFDEYKGSAFCGVSHKPIFNKEIKSNKFDSRTIIFPDQSPNQILNGYAKGSMPDEYVGGVGKDGAANLRKFVEAGGTLVFLNRASDFAIEQFGLPLRDVTDGLKRKDFYIPGSILRTEIDTNHPIAKGMPKDSIAWFEDSAAFEITMSDDTNVQIIAKYPNNPKDILLSGWALGAEKIAGKAALVQVNIGKGKVILFGFRPQYRGQSLATFPLLFNAISGN
ncbi:MAG: hypothetical protein K1X72_11905 [Pyrinomonadaceae bacterium]|nr:hypothetical protein [Pyrinomonadaceae bacterium]